jgi:hypothetical protein
MARFIFNEYEIRIRIVIAALPLKFVESKGNDKQVIPINDIHFYNPAK